MNSRDRLGRKRRVHLHDERPTHEARDRRNVANKVEIEIFVECRIDEVRGCDQEERVAVRRCLGDGCGCDVGPGAGPVLDDELLTEALR